MIKNYSKVRLLKIYIAFVIFTFVVIFFQSCTTTKQTQTTKTEEHSIDDTRTVSTTTTTQTADTTIYIKADTLASKKPLYALQGGDSLIEETDTQELIIKLDKKGNINAVAISKKKAIPVIIKVLSATSATTTGHKVKKTNIKTSDTKKEKQGLFSQLNLNYAWWLLLLLLWPIWKSVRKS